MKFYSNLQNYAPFILFTALFSGIIAPALWSDGMFTDGIIYADISRNLAEGYGSFWHLHFSETLIHDFYGHPPLAFYLTSLLFNIFGDTIFIERLYSFLTGIIAAGLIVQILKTNFKKSKNLSIISLFVWLMFPLVNWTYANNMLENTVTVFVLLSTYFLMLNFKKRNHLMLFFAGISLFAAFLTKGLTALFVWSVPFFYFLVFRKINFKQLFSDTFFLIFYTVFPFLLLFSFSKDGNSFFIHYFNNQILKNVNLQTVNNHFYIIPGIIKEMIVPGVLFFILLTILKIKKQKIIIRNEYRKNALFFLLIALAGILPIMISIKQRNFYIVPALPFLAISSAFLLNDVFSCFKGSVNFFKRKLFIFLSYGLFVLSFVIILFVAGKPGRDKDKVYDCYKLKTEIPENEIISLNAHSRSDWSFLAYLQRYGKYSVEVNNKNTYYLTDRNFSDSTYERVNLGLKKYILYKKKTKF